MEFTKENLNLEQRITSGGEQTFSSVVDIVFSSSILKVTFIEDKIFAGRKLVMNGEALDCGFYAYSSSMKWLSPFENDKIDDETKLYIIDKILQQKYSNGFNIIINEV